MIVAMMVIWLMTLLEPLMIDDFDSPLMEIAHDDGSLYGPMMAIAHDDSSLLSFENHDDVSDDVNGGHDDVALADGGAHVGDALCLHVFVDACGWTPCLMMALEP